MTLSIKAEHLKEKQRSTGVPVKCRSKAKDMTEINIICFSCISVKRKRNLLPYKISYGLR